MGYQAHHKPPRYSESTLLPKNNTDRQLPIITCRIALWKKDKRKFANENQQRVTRQGQNSGKTPQQQKEYHDKNVHEQPPLYKGQNVWVQNHDDKKWMPGVVVDKRPEPQSYEIETENGSVLRWNRRHIRETGEKFERNKQHDTEIEIAETPENKTPKLQTQSQTPPPPHTVQITFTAPDQAVRALSQRHLTFKASAKIWESKLRGNPELHIILYSRFWRCWLLQSVRSINDFTTFLKVINFSRRGMSYYCGGN